MKGLERDPALRSLVELPDFLGPQTVKELRQGTRSQTAFTFCFGTLIVATMITLGAQSQPTPGAPSGAGALTFLYQLGSLVVVLIIPAMTFQSVLRELSTGTHELLLASGLSGWGIVWGKLSSSLCLAAVTCSLLLPFCTFSYFLRGVSLADIALRFLSLMLLSISTTSVTILLASTGRQRAARWLDRLGALVIAAVFAYALVTLSPVLLFLDIGFPGAPSALMRIGVFALSVFCWTPVFLAAAQGKLGRTGSFDTPSLRVTVAVVVLVLLLADVLLAAWLPLPGLQTVIGFTLCAMFLLLAWTLCTGPSRPSRRALAVFPRSPIRALWLGPGVHRGALFCLTIGAWILIVSLVLPDLPGRSFRIAVVTFVTIFLVGSPIYASLFRRIGLRLEQSGPILLLLFGWLSVMVAALDLRLLEPVRSLFPFSNEFRRDPSDLLWPGAVALGVLLAHLLRLRRTERETAEWCQLRSRRAPALEVPATTEATT